MRISWRKILCLFGLHKRKKNALHLCEYCDLDEGYKYPIWNIEYLLWRLRTDKNDKCIRNKK